MAAMDPPPHTAALTTAPYTTAGPATSPNSPTTSRPSSTTTVDSRLLILRSSPTTTISKGSHPTPSRDTIPLPPSSPPTATTTTVIRVQTRSPMSMPTHGTHMAPSLKPLTCLAGTTHPRAFSTLPPRSPSSPLQPSQSLPVVALGSMKSVVTKQADSLLSCSCNSLTSLPSSSRMVSTKDLQTRVTSSNSQSTSLELSKTT